METAQSSAASASVSRRQETFPIPITITSVALKKGFPATRALCANRFTYQNKPEDRTVLFILEKTSRDFDRWRFSLEPGCIISDKTGDYQCLEIGYTTRPRHPYIRARLIRPRFKA